VADAGLRIFGFLSGMRGDCEEASHRARSFPLIPKADFILDCTDTFFANPVERATNALATEVNTSGRDSDFSAVTQGNCSFDDRENEHHPASIRERSAQPPCRRERTGSFQRRRSAWSPESTSANPPWMPITSRPRGLVVTGSARAISSSACPAPRVRAGGVPGARGTAPGPPGALASIVPSRCICNKGPLNHAPQSICRSKEIKLLFKAFVHQWPTRDRVFSATVP
jgi:hypothetical protein